MEIWERCGTIYGDNTQRSRIRDAGEVYEIYGRHREIRGDTKRYEREIGRSLGDRGKSMGDTGRYTEVRKRDGVIPERYGEMRKGNLCENREIHGRY
jgi:hypothetical protein